jgi:hypothetical protein
MNETQTKILQLFEFSDNPINKRKQIPHRIKIGGQFIVSCDRKKKTVWPSIGAAKSAFNLHYKEKICRTILKHNSITENSMYYPYYTSDLIESVWLKFFNDSIKSGFLEFIPFHQ